MNPRSNQKPSFGHRSTLQKHVTSMSCRLEPAIWSHDTGQQIPYFDRCQLIITWMSDIKEVHGKPRLHVSVNLLLEYGRHVARLDRRRRRRSRREYAPTSNTASHGTHEKIISWVPFRSLIWVWGSAWRSSAIKKKLKVWFYATLSFFSPLHIYPLFSRLRWLKTVSGTFQALGLMGHNHELPLFFNWCWKPLYHSKHVGIIFVTQYVTIAKLCSAKNTGTVFFFLIVEG